MSIVYGQFASLLVMGSVYVAQAGLDFVNSGDPSTSAFQVHEITGVLHPGLQWASLYK